MASAGLPATNRGAGQLRARCCDRWLGWQHGAVAGATLWLDLPHVGVRGWAEIVGVRPCPVIQPGPGRLIIGWFCHSSAAVCDLRVAGEPVAIRVTAAHPFWSADRREWVPVGELQVGERLLGQGDHQPQVLAVAARVEPEPVFNLEVDADHCYRVGQQGLLVHNSSAGCDPCDDAKLTGSYPDTSAYALSSGDVVYYDLSPFLDGTSDPKKARHFLNPLSILARIARKTGEEAGSDFRKWFKKEKISIAGTTEKTFGLMTDTVGHVIGKDFGGSADKPGLYKGNIFPQDKKSNNEDYGQVEEQLRTAIKNSTSQHGCIRLIFTYRAGKKYPVRPVSFTVEWWVDGKPHGTTPTSIANPGDD